MHPGSGTDVEAKVAAPFGPLVGLFGQDATGMPRPGEGGEYHPWAEGIFADPSVHSFWVDVFYRGSHVERHTLVSADGNRAYFPSPNPTRADSDELVLAPGEAVFTWPVTEEEYAFVAVINGLDRNDLEGLFSRTDVMIVRSE